MQRPMQDLCSSAGNNKEGLIKRHTVSFMPVVNLRGAAGLSPGLWSL